MTTLELRPIRRVATREFTRQAVAAAELELRRLLGRPGLPALGLALSPLTIFLAWAALGSEPATELSASGEQARVFAVIFKGLLTRLVIFLGCVALFSNAFRREILDETLHYALLTPVRRGALVMGKYVAGVLWGSAAFGLMVGASLALFYAPFGTQLVTTQTLADGLAYVGITVLAVVGYGALFLTIGLYVRNPILPAVVVLIWESVSFVLPSALQKLTVIHYLDQLSPVPLPSGMFEIQADPTPAYIAVPGLLFVSGLLLAVATRRLSRIEVSYGSD